jgi:hypothetical protein
VWKVRFLREKHFGRPGPRLPSPLTSSSSVVVLEFLVFRRVHERHARSKVRRGLSRGTTFPESVQDLGHQNRGGVGNSLGQGEGELSYNGVSNYRPHEPRPRPRSRPRLSLGGIRGSTVQSLLPAPPSLPSFPSVSFFLREPKSASFTLIIFERPRNTLVPQDWSGSISCVPVWIAEVELRYGKSSRSSDGVSGCGRQMGGPW